MQHHFLVPLLAAVANSIIALLVLRRGFRDPLHRAFVGMTLTVICWNLDIWSLYYFADQAAAEWWSRLFRTGMCLAPATVLHFALRLSQSEGRGWTVLLVALYTTGVCLAIENLRGALVRGLTRHSWGWYVEPGPLYAGMTLSLLVVLPLFIERVWRTYRHPATPRQGVQAKFWLLGSIIQVPFALANLLPLYGFGFYPIGDLGSVFFAGVLAYAIARHRLMDVDYVVRKGVSFSVAAAIVLVPGSLVLESLARRAGAHEPVLVVCAALALAVASAVLIPLFQAALETRVQRAFFPQRYDSRLRLRQLPATLVSVLDQGELARRLGDALGDILDVESCHVFVRDVMGARILLVHPPAASEPDMVPDEVVAALERAGEPVLASELEAMRSAAAPYFRSRGWEAAIPLRIEERLTGFVALGRNRDFRLLSVEDLELLRGVAAGASVALENASLSRQLRRSETVLERANRLSSLGVLAAGIAHEIRNPLVAVKTFLDLLPQKLEDRAFLTQFRDLSLSELKRVTDLIADLLALGKSKTAERRAVDVGPTLEPVVRLMESTARKRQVGVVVRVAPGLPHVWADPDQLKQIALNLLLNAIDASPAGGQVLLDFRPHGEHAVVLEVRDAGPGIPREQRENIFHPFYTTKESGTGLGLALVHQMVVEHGGEITVDSERDHGTTFRVTLPTVRPETSSRVGDGRRERPPADRSLRA